LYGLPTLLEESVAPDALLVMETHTHVEAIRRLFQVDASRDRAGNLPSMTGIDPDYPAPIVRNGNGGRELAKARWDMPSSQRALMDATKKRAQKLEAKGKPVDFKELLRLEPDGGTTSAATARFAPTAMAAPATSTSAIPPNNRRWSGVAFRRVSTFGVRFMPNDRPKLSATKTVAFTRKRRRAHGGIESR